MNGVQPESALFRANEALHQGNVDEGKRLIDREMRNLPLAAPLLNLEGVRHELDGLLSDALRYYRASIALDPRFLPTVRNLCRCTTMPYGFQGLALGIEAKGLGNLSQ